MHIRFRSLAALFALLALSLFWVEGVWASMCPPEMEIDAPAAMSVDVGTDASVCPIGMAVPSSDSDENRSEGPHCPLTLGASSCTVGLAFAAETAIPVVPSPEGARLVGSPDHAKDLLLAVALFHPPRA
jgi:hypothetical protein